MPESLYRANVVRLVEGRTEGEILRDLARRCSALWNVGLYLCRQRFFATGERVPGYTALCAELSDHPIYRSLPSDVAQEVLKKLSEAWVSYWGLRVAHAEGRLRDKPGLPRYRKSRRTGEYLEDWIPFKHPRSYALDAHTVSLTLPHDLRAQLGGGRLVVPYLGIRRHAGKGGRAEVLYNHARGRWYLRWSVEQVAKEMKVQNRAAGIDLGVRIALSLSVEGDSVATHYSGRNLLRDFDYWGRRIARHQRELAHREKKSSRRLRRMHAKRKARFEHAIEAMAKDVVRRCVRQRVGVVYLGYPKGILREVRYGSGAWAEKIHNFWRFDVVLRILEKHLHRANIHTVRVGERGTSSTCTADPAPAKKTHKVVRGPRHWLSCRTCGLRMHSDQAGSRNMLRVGNPSIGWVGVEATPRTETRTWNHQVWTDSENRYLTRLIAAPEPMVLPHAA